MLFYILYFTFTIIQYAVALQYYMHVVQYAVALQYYMHLVQYALYSVLHHDANGGAAQRAAPHRLPTNWRSNRRPDLPGGGAGPLLHLPHSQGRRRRSHPPNQSQSGCRRRQRWSEQQWAVVATNRSFAGLFAATLAFQGSLSVYIVRRT